MPQNRRQFLILISAAGFGLSNGLLPRPSFGQEKKGTRVILLGTKGGPRVDASGRSNSSTLLLINDVPYVIDCGYGTSRQLVAAGVAHNRLRYLFITHHHSDHNIEYGTLFYNAWITGLAAQVNAYGPPGLVKMTRDFFSYMRSDIDIRIEDEGRLDPRKMLVPHDVTRPGVVMQNEMVKVTAAKVRHPLVKHAFAYRFDTKDRSVVISGDTTYSPELAELAKGADVLVHEILYLPGIEAVIKRIPNATRLRKHIIESHTLPEDVGKVAAQAGVRTLVLSHFVPGDNPSITDEQWTEGVRKHFSGRIIVGKDLMEI